MKKLLGIIVAVIGIVTTVSVLIFKVKGYMSVISGADGPTAIFFAGRIGNGSFLIGMVVGIVLLATGIFMIAKKK